MRAATIIVLFSSLAFTSGAHAQWQKVNAPSYNISWIAVHHPYVFLGTDGEGLHRSFLFGDIWKEVGWKANSDATCFVAAYPHVFVGSEQDGIFRSKDDGLSWAQVNEGLPANCRVQCLEAKPPYIYSSIEYKLEGEGQQFAFFVSTDNGESWIQKEWEADAFIQRMGIHGSYLFAAVMKPYLANDHELALYRSSDAGDSWSKVWSDWRGAANFSGCHNIESGQGFVFASLMTEAGILRSSDDGDTWVSVWPVERFGPTMVVVANENIFTGSWGLPFVSGAGVFRSNCEEPSAWTYVGPATLQASFLDASGPFLFAVVTRDEFGLRWQELWRRPLSELLTSVDAVGNREVPTEHALAQNYPNPFNPSTTIEYAIPHSGFVTLRVYNVLGEEVATLVAGEHAAGTYTANWNASSMPSGVYFYRLTAVQYVQTKKAVLMK